MRQPATLSTIVMALMALLIPTPSSRASAQDILQPRSELSELPLAFSAPDMTSQSGPVRMARRPPRKPLHTCCHLKGALIGAAIGAGLGWWFTWSLCEGDCTSGNVRYMAVLGGLGATFGAFVQTQPTVPIGRPSRRPSVPDTARGFGTAVRFTF